MAAFVHRFRTRYHECDAQGIVFNANHITYVDVALTELSREAFGSHGSMTDGGYDLIVADVHAAFRAPVAFDAEVALSLTIERFGRTSMTTSWTTAVGERLCVEGEIVHVWIETGGMTPVAIPDHVREAFAPYGADPS